ncbi:MAG: carbohydrate kinase family protein [Betaproteobacteria bacterium]|nr:MAG: carbohydrate kinase family protein [Betaproteobacteria bacterium]
MQSLICGSLAFDNIMNFQGRFGEQILPDRIHILNVSFLVPQLKRDFGGCAGNIAYNLKLLGGDPSVVATVGDDGAEYAQRFDALGINRTQVSVVPGTLTAQAFIITDLDNNQITAFHPGAMMHAHINRIGKEDKPRVGIISPDGPEGMLQHAEDFFAAGVPFIFDPGQALPSFTGEQLHSFIERATYLAVNDYEGAMLAKKVGMSLTEIAGKVDALIVTRGGEGSTIYADGQEIVVAPIEVARVTDPTGCGDAYRAGLLYGITKGLSWENTGQIASAIASIKIEYHGGQNHRPSIAEIFERCADAQPA